MQNIKQRGCCGNLGFCKSAQLSSSKAIDLTWEDSEERETRFSLSWFFWEGGSWEIETKHFHFCTNRPLHVPDSFAVAARLGRALTKKVSVSQMQKALQNYCSVFFKYLFLTPQWQRFVVFCNSRPIIYYVWVSYRATRSSAKVHTHKYDYVALYKHGSVMKYGNDLFLLLSSARSTICLLCKFLSVSTTHVALITYLYNRRDS